MHRILFLFDFGGPKQHSEQKVFFQNKFHRNSQTHKKKKKEIWHYFFLRFRSTG